MELYIAILNVSVIPVQLRTYAADSNNLVWKRDHTKSNANYVSTLAENGLAMAGPAGLVPAPMTNTLPGVPHKAMQGIVCQVVLHKHTTRCVAQLSVCLHSPPVIVGLSVLYLSCCDL